MFNRSFLAGMKRGGFGTNISKNKLSKYMFDILMQLPEGTANLKETIVASMGMIGQKSATRDINAAWDMARKMVAREFPSKFVLTSRSSTSWPERQPRPKVKKLTAEVTADTLSAMERDIKRSPVLSALGVQAKARRGRFYFNCATCSE